MLTFVTMVLCETHAHVSCDNLQAIDFIDLARAQRIVAGATLFNSHIGIRERRVVANGMRMMGR